MIRIRPWLRLLVYLAGSALVILVVLLLVFRASAALRERHAAGDLAPAGGYYVDIGGERIYLQQYGPDSGRALILVHGTAAWSGLWHDTSTFLAGIGYRVYALDMPPFGFSERPAEPAYGRADQARRIGRVVETLGIADPVIVGHSFGGGAAVEAVLRDPDLYGGLILVDPALGLTSEGVYDLPPLLRPAWLRELIVSATATNPLLTRKLLASLLHRKDRALPGYVEILQRPLATRGATRAMSDWLPFLLITEINALSAYRDRYRAIGIPVALIWGAEDTVTPLDQARDLQSLIDGAPLEILPGVGHIPQLEDPAAFRRAIAGLLARIGKR